MNFADFYYQTRGDDATFAPNPQVPLGRPIPGAYDVLLNSALPAGLSSAGSIYTNDDAWVEG